jgi:predicted Rossmann fold nucleotide-binding protein DprA/Smf involved in DNA uptake
MKLAIIGSRGLRIDNLDKYIGEDVTEIVSGGARGVDSDAETYAEAIEMKLTVFLPDYRRYGRGAPIVRNRQIVEYADEVLAFWDGSSKGTEFVINYCKKQGKKITVVIKKQ